jgi:hypothetical protein
MKMCFSPRFCVFISLQVLAWSGPLGLLCCMHKSSVLVPSALVRWLHSSWLPPASAFQRLLLLPPQLPPVLLPATLLLCCVGLFGAWWDRRRALLGLLVPTTALLQIPLAACLAYSSGNCPVAFVPHLLRALPFEVALLVSASGTPMTARTAVLHVTLVWLLLRLQDSSVCNVGLAVCACNGLAFFYSAAVGTADSWSLRWLLLRLGCRRPCPSSQGPVPVWQAMCLRWLCRCVLRSQRRRLRSRRSGPRNTQSASVGQVALF